MFLAELSAPSSANDSSVQPDLNNAEVKAAFERMLVRDPQNIDLLVNLGATQIRAKRYQSAITHLNAALKIRSDYVPALLALGQLKYATQQYQEGMLVLKQAVQLDPKNASAHYMLAQTAAALGLDDVHKKALSRASELDPSLVEDTHPKIRF